MVDKKSKNDDVKEEVTPQVAELESNSNVTVNLDVDPNDPRKIPAVDGGSQPKLDINKPIAGVKEAA